jgi:hypothetical protein
MGGSTPLIKKVGKCMAKELLLLFVSLHVPSQRTAVISSWIKIMGETGDLKST